MGLRYADAILKRAGKTQKSPRTKKKASHEKLFTQNKSRQKTATQTVTDGFTQHKASMMTVMLDGFSQ